MWLLAGGLLVGGSFYAFISFFPREYQQFLIFFAIQSISVASRIQMISMKAKRLLLPLFGSPHKYIEFIADDNTVMYKTTVDNLNHEIIDNLNYDLVVYSEPGDKTIYKWFTTISTPELPTTLVPSNIRFILTELIANNQTIKLDFACHNDNYYVVGNIFNARFINYFVHRYYKVDSLANYTLNIIDNNVNMIQIGADDSIRLDKDTYTIIHKKSTISS
jgi:hypothetical protein